MATISSNFIYIGNLADLDPDETNFDNENDAPLYRTFANAEIADITVVQDDANGDGEVQSNDNGQTADTFSYDAGSGPVTSALDSEARYFVDYTDENGDTQSTVISIYQTVNGDTFAKFPNGIKLQDFTVTGKAMDGFMSITHGTTSSATVVCYAAGTMIDTTDGPRAIQNLRIGDLVLTADHGAQPVRWLRTSGHSLDDLDDTSRPIRIRANALGPDRPAADMIVSPQHRILVGDANQMTDCFQEPAFVAAKALTGLRGVNVLRRKSQITWVHFACDRHEIITANGCQSETLLFGPMVVAGLRGPEKSALLAGFLAPYSPHDPLNGPVARPVLPVALARRMVRAARRQSGQAALRSIVEHRCAIGMTGQ